MNSPMELNQQMQRDVTPQSGSSKTAASREPRNKLSSIVQAQIGAADTRRFLEREGTLLAQLASLTSPESLDTTYLTHGIHPYPAKYIPQLPNLIIREHTNERNTVLDPFCGSGTTLLEAALLGRKSIGIDSHPVAALISKAKTTALTEAAIDEAAKLVDSLATGPLPTKLKVPTLPEDLNVRHWFSDVAIKELYFLRGRIDAVADESLRDFLTCVFSSIIVTVSNQESETRYAAIEKDLSRGDVTRRFVQKLRRELQNIRALSEIGTVARNTPRIFNTDLKRADALGLKRNSVDLVVTSPPYPNSFDYYLYHKWRLFWLGYDYREVKNAEIGSRNEHSSLRQPIDAYVVKMRQAMIQIASLLKPSKLAYFFVGDAVIAGELLNIAEVFKQIVEGTELRMIADTNYSLESVTRSFHEKKSEKCHGGRRNVEKQQHVLVFEKVNSKRVIVSVDTAQATPKAERVSVDLSKKGVQHGAVIAVRSKEDQRHIHSLGRYPSRFFPDIPRWLISEFSEPGQVVFDPFMGSGTTAVEAMVARRHVVGSDISPYSCLLTSAKVSRPSEASLKEFTKQFLSDLDKNLRGIRPTEFDVPLADFWFHPGYIEQLAQARAYIDKFAPQEALSYFYAVLSTVIRPSSYQDEGQIKVKRDPKKVLNGTPTPFRLLEAALPKNLERKLAFLRAVSADVNGRIYNASADDAYPNFIERDSIDLIVTSPPYINAMNYPMTHRYENIILGLVEAQELHAHERQYFGSERVFSREYSELQQFPQTFERAAELNRILQDIYRGEPKRSFIAFRFFSLMQKAFASMAKAVRPGGAISIVVGRNTIRGVHVDTFGLLASMLEPLGFQLRLAFEYEIIKNAFKLTRHPTAAIIKTDGVAILEKIG